LEIRFPSIENGCGGAGASSSGLAGGGGYGSSGQTIIAANGQASIGGVSFGTTDLSKIFFGCAGGSGRDFGTLGGNGGGTIIVFANTLRLSDNAAVSANGGAGEIDYSKFQSGQAPGGGAGGSILLDINNLFVQAGRIEARGNNLTGVLSSNGGVGRIRINYRQINNVAYPNAGSGINSLSIAKPMAFGGQSN
jgi:hypothetical protein